jgi:hypothetical protein
MTDHDVRTFVSSPGGWYQLTCVCGKRFMAESAITCHRRHELHIITMHQRAEGPRYTEPVLTPIMRPVVSGLTRDNKGVE